MRRRVLRRFTSECDMICDDFDDMKVNMVCEFGYEAGQITAIEA